MARPVSYDIIDMVFKDVGNIKEASHQRRHIPQEHMVALNLCLDEAQLDGIQGAYWQQENIDVGYEKETYFEFWRCAERRLDYEDFLRWECGEGGIVQWCKDHAKPPETLGWHQDPVAGDSIKILNNW